MGALLLKYATLFFWSTWKFSFAPTAGWNMGLNFFEILIIHTLGGWLSFITFFYAAEYFMHRAKRKKDNKLREAIKEGKEIKRVKSQRLNRFIITVKSSRFGYWFLLCLSATFIGIQIGAIITAKFFLWKKHVYLHSLLIFTLTSFLLTYLWHYTKVFGN